MFGTFFPLSLAFQSSVLLLFTFPSLPLLLLPLFLSFPHLAKATNTREPAFLLGSNCPVFMQRELNCAKLGNSICTVFVQCQNWAEIFCGCELLGRLHHSGEFVQYFCCLAPPSLCPRNCVTGGSGESCPVPCFRLSKATGEYFPSTKKRARG